MLYRLGKLAYLALFVVLVYTWTQWHKQSGEALHHSWEVTREKFAQSTSFADDILDHSYFHSKPSPVTTSLISTTPSTTVSMEPLSTSSSSLSIDIKPPINTSAIPSVYSPSPYAYVFYATEDAYACSVLVNIQRLQDVLHTRHRIFVLVSSEVGTEYVEAFKRRNVTVSLQTPPPLAEGSATYYASCLLKLLAFKMHHIDPSLKKVISMDSDQLVLQNLDHLFESSVEVDLAAPRAYWIAKDAISSTFMVITLSERLWNTVDHAIKTIKVDKYDMDLVYDLFGDTVMMLPGSYVGVNSHWEDWNLPHWFHTKNTPEVAEAASVNASSNASSTVVHQPASTNLDRRHIAVRRQTPTQAHSKQGDEEEQTNASSGDIFAYLDKPIESSPSDDGEGATQNAYDQPLPTAPAQAEAAEEEEPSYHILEEVDSDVETAPVQKQQPELKHQHLSPAELEKQPLYKDLYDLASEVPVLHFFALGKPWTFTLNNVVNQRPGAHPLFVEQFRMWRETALRVCPAGILDGL